MSGTPAFPLTFPLAFLLASLAGPLSAIAQPAPTNVVALPPGVTANWNLDDAYREATPTRERISLNGLWRWQPSSLRPPIDAAPATSPTNQWGYFKVPGCWPGITDYMQKDAQMLYTHPAWARTALRDVAAAWQERSITIPTQWADRRIALACEYLNSYATVFIDGRQVGSMVFPEGDLDLSNVCTPGRTYRLSLLVSALPLKAVLLSHSDSANAREVVGRVERRGLCGDVWLISTPPGPHLGDVRVEPSFRQRQLTLDVGLHNPTPDSAGNFRGRIRTRGQVVHEFSSPSWTAAMLREGRFRFVENWAPQEFWDLHTPTHQLELELDWHHPDGRLLDRAWLTSFGFRELWIDGRDFWLNGSRLFLSTVPLDNAQVSAASATYAATRESLRRLKAIGINYVYTHNYGCEPGSHLGFAEILRAADDVGMLVGLSQPHFSQYEWPTPDSDQTNGYASLAAFYVRTAGNHPSVVFYPMSHNATGYNEDMNPHLMDGVQAPRDAWAERNRERALRAEAIVRKLDPSRIVYHHASGNLGAFHNSNFYPNFVPIQEMSDWFGPWSSNSIKPMLTCEFAAPFTWDWTLYRGWYNGQREFGSAKVPWEFCLAEWNAQFLGAEAYRISAAELANLRWESAQYKAGRTWHRWDYPHAVGSDRFEERYPIFARYITDNWRAFRTWGVSGTSPWDHGHYWTVRPDVARRQKQALDTDWQRLQRPGFSPDFIDPSYERVDLAYAESDWNPTAAAVALLRNNQPLLAYIAGKPTAFTAKDHNFIPGERIEKQAILINNSRASVTATVEWSLESLPPQSRTVTVPTGEQARIPLEFTMPPARAGQSPRIQLRARFSPEAVQEDTFELTSSPPPKPKSIPRRIALFDPANETRAWLQSRNIPFTPIEPASNLDNYDLLIVGKRALSPTNPAPDIRGVRSGLKVLVFEQTADALHQRLGLRIQDYGLRQVFPRIPDHPALQSLETEHLRDWRGSATLLPPQLAYTPHPRLGPTIQWSGLTVPHLWRASSRGNVASTLIEKPGRGDFLPILDGGFSLQYSPLLEFREGTGVVIFCQTDVTGRTETDPAADTLVLNLLDYLAHWKAQPRRRLLYAGPPTGQAFLEHLGFAPQAFVPPRTLADAAAKGSPLDLVVLGPGAPKRLAAEGASAVAALHTGGPVLAIGFTPEDGQALQQENLRIHPGEHVATYFPAATLRSAFAGIAPADVHNRDPKIYPLIAAGPEILGNGIFAADPATSLLFCQLVPWELGDLTQPHLRRTHRRHAFALSRLLANLGAASTTPLLERFHTPVTTSEPAPRWQTGLYLDTPVEWDDPYRFFRW